MSLRLKYLKIMSEILPGGLVGISMLLGSTMPSAGSEHPPGLQPPASDIVSERLAAIRGAVAALDQKGRAAGPDERERQLAWGNWWRNWGWGRPWRWGWPNWPNWHNWRNWGNWWHNW